MIYYFVLFLIIVVLGLAVLYLYKTKKENENEISVLEKERDEYAEFGRDLAEYNQRMQEKKNLAKDKILEIIKQKVKICNSDAVKLLEVSSATVVRYLDELEKEGKIKQVGKTGKKVFYTL